MVSCQQKKIASYVCDCMSCSKCIHHAQHEEYCSFMISFDAIIFLIVLSVTLLEGTAVFGLLVLFGFNLMYALVAVLVIALEVSCTTQCYSVCPLKPDHVHITTAFPS